MLTPIALATTSSTPFPSPGSAGSPMPPTPGLETPHPLLSAGAAGDPTSNGAFAPPDGPHVPPGESPSEAPPWWNVRVVGEDERRLFVWARRSGWVGLLMLALASLTIMASMLAAPSPNPLLDGSPADPAMTQRAMPMSPVQRPGLLPSAEPDRVTMGTHTVGTLSQSTDWSNDLLHENHGHRPLVMDLRARFNRVPATWRRIASGKISMIVGDASSDPQPARLQVQVVPGSGLAIKPAPAVTPSPAEPGAPLRPSTPLNREAQANQASSSLTAAPVADSVRLTVPADQVVWGYTVATQANDLGGAPAGSTHPARPSLGPAAMDRPLVVVRIGSVPLAMVQAKTAALDLQDTIRLIGATLGTVGMLALAWAGLCVMGAYTARQDVQLLARTLDP